MLCIASVSLIKFITFPTFNTCLLKWIVVIGSNHPSLQQFTGSVAQSATESFNCDVTEPALINMRNAHPNHRGHCRSGGILRLNLRGSARNAWTNQGGARAGVDSRSR